jgi:hypothetical protein
VSLAIVVITTPMQQTVTRHACPCSGIGVSCRFVLYTMRTYAHQTLSWLRRALCCAACTCEMVCSMRDLLANLYSFSEISERLVERTALDAPGRAVGKRLLQNATETRMAYAVRYYAHQHLLVSRCIWRTARVRNYTVLPREACRKHDGNACDLPLH